MLGHRLYRDRRRWEHERLPWRHDPDEHWRLSYRIAYDGMPDVKFSIVVDSPDGKTIKLDLQNQRALIFFIVQRIMSPASRSPGTFTAIYSCRSEACLDGCIFP